MASGTVADGARHLRAEWGRWWRGEDLTDTHIAHRLLNDQWRQWNQIRTRFRGEVNSNIGLLKQQQRLQTQMQMQRMHMQRRGGGRYGGGYGGYFGGSGGASPFIAYKMMQWSQLSMKVGLESFQHTELTSDMLAIGRGQAVAVRHRAAFGWILGLLVVWAGLWWLSPRAGAYVTGAAVLLYLLLAFQQGRRPTRRRPPVPRLLFTPPEPPAHTELSEEAEPEPFPIREAGLDPRRAREAVQLALKKHNVQVSEVLVPEQFAYGWKVPLVLDGPAADLMKALPKVAVTLRVGESRVLAQAADPNDAALASMQVLTQDPFATPPPYPQRAPGSCSIRNQVSLGISIEGENTPVVLAGQHVIVVADTGGGKTALVQALAEFVTACRDAVVVDIDPAKRGLKALAPAAVMTARTPEEAEKVLESLLARATARIASMPPTQDMWEPTPDQPAVICFIDEFPQMSDRGKELAIRLLRLGREAMITIVLMTQDATSDVLSDAVADAFPIRIMLPCRQDDVPLVVGQRNAVSKGWLPHLLVPSPEPGFPADAGRFYCITPRHRTPVLRYVTPLPPDEADRRTRERVAAGLPRLETAVSATPAPVPAELPEIARLLLDAFATHSNPEALTIGQLADALAAADPAVWGQWNGQKNRLLMVGRTIKARLRDAGLDIPTVRIGADIDPKRPTAYRLADIRGALS